MRSEVDIVQKSSVDDLATGVPKYSQAVKFQDLFFTSVRGPEVHDQELAVSIETIPIGFLHTAEMDWADDVSTTLHGTRQTWADKYITSPPITTAQISVFILATDFRHCGWKYVTVYDPHGITYGTTAEILEKMRASEPVDDDDDLEKRDGGTTTISFVTEKLAPGSTVAWHDWLIVQSWAHVMQDYDDESED
jgi:hypothetical protein